MMLELQNIHKKLGKFYLKDISLRIPKGYICGLIGPNGAGKTSLIQKVLKPVYVRSQGFFVSSNHIFLTIFAIRTWEDGSNQRAYRQIV